MTIRNSIFKKMYFYVLPFIFSWILFTLPIQMALAEDCTDIKTECIEPVGTRYFDGVPVTLDCWKYQITRKCATPSANNCESLRAQGCEETGSTCKTQIDGICVVADKSFRCPVKKCESNTGIICGGDTFCLKGDCTKHEKIPDQDMSQSISALSAIANASKEFSADGAFIFTGHAKKCASDFIGFCNCCSDSGWGKDVHLASCTDDEKKLGHDKELGLTIYVGEYCANKDPTGVFCIEHKKSYCVYQSKLARIVQQQGVLEQLGKSLGGAENPICTGITPEELQKIDFSKIDFSEFYSDITAKEKIYDIGEMNKKITDKIDYMYDNNSPKPIVK